MPCDYMTMQGFGYGYETRPETPVPIACGVCGVALGLGIPGEMAACQSCGQYVTAKAQQQDWGSVALGLGLVLAGILIVALLSG